MGYYRVSNGAIVSTTTTTSFASSTPRTNRTAEMNGGTHKISFSPSLSTPRHQKRNRSVPSDVNTNISSNIGAGINNNNNNCNKMNHSLSHATASSAARKKENSPVHCRFWNVHWLASTTMTWIGVAIVLVACWNIFCFSSLTALSTLSILSLSSSSSWPSFSIIKEPFGQFQQHGTGHRHHDHHHNALARSLRNFRSAREWNETANSRWHEWNDEIPSYRSNKNNINYNMILNRTKRRRVINRDSFSACLLIKDDNDILNEFIAYHYHVLKVTCRQVLSSLYLYIYIYICIYLLYFDVSPPLLTICCFSPVRVATLFSRCD
jgi:hypothetical protein